MKETRDRLQEPVFEYIDFPHPGPAAPRKTHFQSEFKRMPVRRNHHLRPRPRHRNCILAVFAEVVA